MPLVILMRWPVWRLSLLNSSSREIRPKTEDTMQDLKVQISQARYSKQFTSYFIVFLEIAFWLLVDHPLPCLPPFQA